MLWSFRSFSYQLEISKRGNPQNKNKVRWLFSLSSGFGSAPPPGIKHNEDLSSKTFDDAFSLWTRNKYKHGEVFKPVSACKHESNAFVATNSFKARATNSTRWGHMKTSSCGGHWSLYDSGFCLLSWNTLKRDNKSCSRYFSPWMMGWNSHDVFSVVYKRRCLEECSHCSVPYNR